MVKIVTSICVDTDTEDSKIVYPNAGDFLSRNAKRKIYWKLVTTFCCSSIRCNPEQQHYVYTNDQKKILIGNIDIKQFLKNLGVKILYLPFEKFVPPKKYCTQFRNAYYKLDVIAELAKDEQSSCILLDSDCLWNRHDNSLFKLIELDHILLRDIFEVNNPHEPGRQNLSMADMGKIYKKIDPEYPCLYPIWYGGEMIAGTGRKFKIIANELQSLFEQASQENIDSSSFTFSNGETIFDNEEYCSSFIYNKGLIKIYDAKKYLKRILTIDNNNNVKKDDLQIPIWHLPTEKRRGLNCLFKKAVNLKSKFWQIPLEEFTDWLGKYVGIPQRELSLSEQTYLQADRSYRRFRSRLLRLSSKIIKFSISK